MNERARARDRFFLFFLNTTALNVIQGIKRHHHPLHQRHLHQRREQEKIQSKIRVFFYFKKIPLIYFLFCSENRTE